MLIGFVVAIPFMDTSLYIGYASSHWLQYGDIAYVVAFVVGGAVYAVLRRLITKSNHETEGVAPPLTELAGGKATAADDAPASV